MPAPLDFSACCYVCKNPINLTSCEVKMKKINKIKSIYLDEEQNKIVSSYAEENYLSFSQSIRLIIKYFFDNLPKRETKNSIKTIASAMIKPDDIRHEIWEDWLQSRQAAKRYTSPLVLARHREQAEKAGVDINEALSVCIESNWTSFRADWYLARSSKSIDGHHGEF